ncbi:hypothetical protein GN244_ATG11703 [Phytophthora infestans]|uniref:FLYWCH-type domain-containing protein n=1 Tax=Phytophthora infestans TaxID=4787 RepID=A0A833W030_PHYIN|nr:hypothetical protein GN244_ATG11703 [Phytophthora infestans]
MDSSYASDDSMTNPFQFDGSDLGDAPSDETIIIPSQSSDSESEAIDGHQLEVTSQAEALPGNRLLATLGTRSVHFRGHSYARYHFHNGTTLYRCSAYRRTKYKAKLFVSDIGAVEAGAHMSNCVFQSRRAPVGPAPAITDRLEEMIVATDTVGVRDVMLTPMKYGAWSGTNFTEVTTK